MLKEYELLMEAARLRELDEIYRVHLQAWANRNVQAVNKKGDRYIYDRFDKFFDAAKLENNDPPKWAAPKNKLKQLMLQANQ